MNYSEIFEDSSIPFDRVKTKSGQNEKGMLLSFARVKKKTSALGIGFCWLKPSGWVIDNKRAALKGEKTRD